jgi:protein O-mannosyl-transferase
MQRSVSLALRMTRLSKSQKAKGTRVAESSSKPVAWWTNNWTICLGLALLTLAVYSQVPKLPFITFDDPSYVSENPHVRDGLTRNTVIYAFTTTDQANWHPLTWLSHAADWQLYGGNAGDHHITNLLIHIVNVCLLFLLLRYATGDAALSALVAGLFAVHPFNVESVAWISERKNLLSTTFWWMTLGAYGWYVLSPNWKRYLPVGLFFACGLASKPMLVTLPAALLLLDYWPLQRYRYWIRPSSIVPIPQKTAGRLLLEKLPLVPLTLASCVITMAVQSGQGAVRPFRFFANVATALRGYALYMLKAIWPSSFAIYYPNPFDPLLNEHPSQGDYALVLIGAVFLVLITFLAFRARRERPYFVVGWLWFVGTLVPVIGLIDIAGQGMADRYAYVPLVGLFVVGVWGAREMVCQWGTTRLWCATAGIVLVAYSSVTMVQLRYWRSTLDLFAHALNVTKNNFVANEKVAAALFQQGRISEAMPYYEVAARLAPWDPVSHAAVAAQADEDERYPDAITAYEVVLQRSEDPDTLGLAYSNLGVIYARQGDYARGREYAHRAAELSPATIQRQLTGLALFYGQNPSAKGYIKLCLLYDNRGQLDQARPACKKAAELAPVSDQVQAILEHLNQE